MVTCNRLLRSVFIESIIVSVAMSKMGVFLRRVWSESKWALLFWIFYYPNKYQLLSNALGMTVLSFSKTVNRRIGRTTQNAPAQNYQLHFLSYGPQTTQNRKSLTTRWFREPSDYYANKSESESESTAAWVWFANIGEINRWLVEIRQSSNNSIWVKHVNLVFPCFVRQCRSTS